MRNLVFRAFVACLAGACLIATPARATTDGAGGARAWSVVVTGQNGDSLEVVQSTDEEATSFALTFADDSGLIRRVTLNLTPSDDGEATTIELDTASEHHVFRVPNTAPCSGPPIAEESLEQAVDNWVTGPDYATLAPLARSASTALWRSEANVSVKAAVSAVLAFTFGDCALPAELDVDAIRLEAQPLEGDYHVTLGEPLFPETHMFSRYSCYWNTTTLDECRSCCDRTAAIGGLLCGLTGLGAVPCSGGVAVSWLFCLRLCHLANP